MLTNQTFFRYGRDFADPYLASHGIGPVAGYGVSIFYLVFAYPGKDFGFNLTCIFRPLSTGVVTTDLPRIEPSRCGQRFSTGSEHDKMILPRRGSDRFVQNVPLPSVYFVWYPNNLVFKWRAIRKNEYILVNIFYVYRAVFSWFLFCYRSSEEPSRTARPKRRRIQRHITCKLCTLLYWNQLT